MSTSTVNVAEAAAEKVKAAAKKAKSAKPAAKKVAAKSAKPATKKANSTPRERIKDAKGREVTGRDNTFKCPECKNDITGPWSFKMHLVNVHEYSRKQAGLRG